MPDNVPVQTEAALIQREGAGTAEIQRRDDGRDNLAGDGGDGGAPDALIEDENGQQVDAIIAEGGIPGDPAGYAVCCIYTVEGDEITVEDEIVYIGDAPNFLEDCCLDGEEREI